eukprot:2639317-Rhodomonas_salina.1
MPVIIIMAIPPRALPLPSLFPSSPVCSLPFLLLPHPPCFPLPTSVPGTDCLSFCSGELHPETKATSPIPGTNCTEKAFECTAHLIADSEDGNAGWQHTLRQYRHCLGETA